MSLKNLRQEIDNIDTGILKLIVKRFEVIKAVGEKKKKNGQEIRDLQREKEIMIRLKMFAQEKGISQEMVEGIYDLILTESRNLQNKISD